jgi:hypothetical protein
MSYLKIDPVLKRWSVRHGHLLMQEETGPGRRFLYVSSTASETFQIVVEPEREGQVRIDAQLIEAGDGVEAHFVWQTTIGELECVLDLIWNSIERWFAHHGGVSTAPARAAAPSAALRPTSGSPRDLRPRPDERLHIIRRADHRSGSAGCSGFSVMMKFARMRSASSGWPWS